VTIFLPTPSAEHSSIQTRLLPELLIRVKYASQKIGRAFAPEVCEPQKSAPTGDAWLQETKWGGYRMVATVVDRKVRIWSRNAVEWTTRQPDLASAVASLKLKDAHLDAK